METIDAKTMKLLFQKGADKINNNYAYIDNLNVYPVPDGDTGTNLKITTGEAFNSIAQLQTNDLAFLTKAFARGLLMNARGNSGVIFSQIFKGFSTVFEPKQEKANVVDLINAFNKAKEFAYKSVSTPVEGTILTVIRIISEKLSVAKTKIKSIEDFFIFLCQEAENILNKTPDFLFELKKAKVVDSGGYGLVCFFEGMKEAILGNNTKSTKKTTLNKNDVNVVLSKELIDSENFGYCTEFIMQLGSKINKDQDDKDEFNENRFKKKITKLGQCFVYVKDGDLVKVHLHTIKPYKLLELASNYGEFLKIKIQNLTQQIKERNFLIPCVAFNQNKPKLVAIVPTMELKKIYAEQFNITNCLVYDENNKLSSQQICNLFYAGESKNIIAIPSDFDTYNIMLQAKKVIDKKINVTVLPIANIATSYLVCSNFNSKLKEKNKIVKKMLKVIKAVESGRILQSTKNFSYKPNNIKIGDYLAIKDKKIIFNSKKISPCCKYLVKKILKKTKKIKTVVIIYGKKITLEKINEFNKYISENYLVKPIFIQSNQISQHYCIGVLN